MICFGIAAVIAYFAPPGRWPFYVALGLLAYVLPIALTASHISHT